MRPTLVYTVLFAVGGAVLVAITYALVAHALPATTTSTDKAATPPASQIKVEIGQCIRTDQAQGDTASEARAKCTALYKRGVEAGASAQRDTTLSHLLTYSLLALAAVTVLAALADWVVAGRILRPAHRLTAAAREAQPCVHRPAAVHRQRQP